MFIIVEHPFADLRAFLGAESGRLAKPMFPLTIDRKQFVRSTGQVKRRRRGGVNDWAGEDFYVDAAKALRFVDQLRSPRLGQAAITGHPRFAIRRCYFDGIVGRFQIGLNIRHRGYAASATMDDYNALICDTLNMPVRISSSPSVPIPLIDAGEPLSRHQLNVTTSTTIPVEPAPSAWWVSAGSPLVIVELPVGISIHKYGLKQIAGALPVALYHGWLEIGSALCSTWFVANSTANPEVVRRLRIHLGRLHAEREGIRLIISHALDDSKLRLSQDPERSDQVQSYLNDALKAIQRPEKFGFNQADILDAARSAYDFALAGSGTTLLHMRRQVVQKIQSYISRSNRSAMAIQRQPNTMITIQIGNVSVGGDFTLATASRIENSFNKIAGANVAPQVREKLEEVTVEVAKLAAALPKEAGDSVARDLESFTGEVTADHPRREWYELSAKGLLEAAKAVAEMTVPVTTAVKAVLALLV